MTRAEELFQVGLKRLPPKPPDTAPAARKKRYSELMSQVVAAALGEELRLRGLDGTLPGGDYEVGTRGAERRMSGGIGAKKVDVTWATEESGLLLAISIKCITSRDNTTGNYQKNVINRRGDMLGEAVTLHRRFPYAVLGGFMFFDEGAASDGSDQRSSTFLNAHRAFRIFTGRSDPSGRDEQYERFYFGLVHATPFHAIVTFTLAGEPHPDLTLDGALDVLLRLLVERNPDFYAILGPNGEIDPTPSATPLSLARMKTSGTIVRGTKTRKARRPQKPQAPQPHLSLDETLPAEDDDEAVSEDD